MAGRPCGSVASQGRARATGLATRVLLLDSLSASFSSLHLTSPRRAGARRASSHLSPHLSSPPHTDLLFALLDSASDVDPRLVGPIARLQDASAAADRLAAAKHVATADEVRALQAVGADVQAHCVDGVYYGTPADAPAGQAYVSDLVAGLADKCHALLEAAGDREMGAETAEIYHALAGHHAHLAALARLPVGELRTEGRAREVARAQGQLQKIDAARSAATGAWGTQPDGSVPPGQAACADLLERCFRLAHKILVRTEKAEAAGVGAEK